MKYAILILSVAAAACGCAGPRPGAVYVPPGQTYRVPASLAAANVPASTNTLAELIVLEFGADRVVSELLKDYGHAPTEAEMHAYTLAAAPPIVGRGYYRPDGSYQVEMGIKPRAYALDGRMTWQEGFTYIGIPVVAGIAALGESQDWWQSSSSDPSGGGGSGGNSGNGNTSTTIHNWGTLNYQSQQGSNDESQQASGTSNQDKEE
jgi:hypothetical protein